VKAFVDPKTRTITWPNGADLEHDVLYDTSLKPAGTGARVTMVVPAG
jgi:hypothetical protein